MRLFAAIICTLMLFPLCSCSLPVSESTRGKSILESFTPSYQTDVTLTSGKLTLRAALSASPGACRVVVTEPRNLAGYSYLLSEDGVEVSYKNLTFSLSPGSPNHIPPLLEAANGLSALLTAQPNTPLKLKEDGYWELTGELDGTPCLLRIEDASGVPVKLLLHDGDMEIKLDNFSFSD